MIGRKPNPVKRDGITIFLDIGQSPASKSIVSDYFLLYTSSFVLSSKTEHSDNPFVITTVFYSSPHFRISFVTLEHLSKQTPKTV